MVLSNQSAVLLVIPAALFWMTFYYAVRSVTSHQSPEFSNRLVTLCHGSLMAINGCLDCFVDGWAFSNTGNSAMTEYQSTLLLASLGYFLFDLTWCLYYQTETKLMIGHHVYSCFAIYRLLSKQLNGNQIMCAMGGMELTNPLLQTRWFIRSLGYHKTKLFLVVELTFILIFVCVRLILGSMIGIYVLFGSGHDWEFKGLAILIYIVSCAFAYNMYKYLKRKYFIPPNDDDTISILTDQNQ